MSQCDNMETTIAAAYKFYNNCSVYVACIGKLN